LVIDRETNILYHALRKTPTLTLWYNINNTTGAANLLGFFPSNRDVLSLAIMSDTEAPVLCDPVTDLEASATGNEVTLSWTAPPGATGYKISFDGAPLTTITGTSYTHTNVPDGFHSYCVTSLFSESCIEQPRCTSPVLVGDDLCELRVEMHTLMHDFWVDASIKVIVDGVEYATLTTFDQLHATKLVAIPEGYTELYFTPGLYTNYCAFEVYDHRGVLLFEAQYNTLPTEPGVLFSFDNDCNCSPPPTNLTVTFKNGCNDANLSWITPYKSLKTLKHIPESASEEFSFSPASSLKTTFSLKPFDDEYPRPMVNLSRDGWLQWCGPYLGSAGDNEAGEYIVAARFLPADLAASSIESGNIISKLGVITDCVEGIYESYIQIYQGGTSHTNPGTLVYEQKIVEYMTPIFYNEISLRIPYEIDATKELWIAYRVITGDNVYPFGTDIGPRVPNKGDLIYYKSTGEWSSLYELAGPGYNYNFNLKAYVTEKKMYNIYRNDELIEENYIETSYIDTDFDPETENTWAVEVVCLGGEKSYPVTVTETCTVCNSVTDLEAEYAENCANVKLIWNAPDSEGIVTYTVLRDGVKIISKLTATSFTDNKFDQNEAHTWEVVTVCADGNESTPVAVSLGICEKINNFKSGFSIVPNPANKQIKVSAHNIFHTIEIISFLGQTIRSISNNSNTAVLDITNLQNGIYFVRVVSDKGTIVRKFVKQN
jgi:hypothetical protein